jgi:hypothetical protein
MFVPLAAHPAAGAEAGTGPGQQVRVQLLIFDPVLHSHGSGRLSDYFGWGDPDTLTAGSIARLAAVSHGDASYVVVDRHEIDEWPVLADGFTYTEDSWFACSSDHTTCHDPWLVDYLRILRNNHSCDLRNQGVIDEVWLWGGPFFGYWESTLTGPGAFPLNSPPLSGSTCQALLPIMGFNYERTVAETMHDFAHRTEAVMDFVYHYAPGSPWRQFSAYDLQAPGQAGCGTVHFPPNAATAYDYSNTAAVPSDCDDWAAWPMLPAHFLPVSCANWGCDEVGYLTWWLGHIPHAKGQTNHVDNDWWHYILIDARKTHAAWQRLL